MSSPALFLLIQIFIFSTSLRSPRVTTACGILEGVETDSIFAFFGIPYSDPPSKLPGYTNRWREPVGTGCWKAGSVYNATFPRNVCIQLFPQGLLGNEDCLYLEVFVPKQPVSSDVLVWVHGGGLWMGSGSIDPLYGSPRTYAEREGITVVSMNYRLGPLGFLALEELSDNSTSRKGTSGNYGFLDVLKALEWVNKNIAAFGGDPTKVTVMGHSAGAALTLGLVTSPLAKGLFRRAISMSGTTLIDTMEDAYVYNYEHLVLKSSCATVKRGERLLECLRNLKAGELAAIYAADGGYFRLLMDLPNPSTPRSFSLLVIDGQSLPNSYYDAFSTGKINDVDLIIGAAREEIDIAPGRNVMNYNSDEYSSLVVSNYARYFREFGPEVLSLYPFDGFKSAQQGFDQLVTDVAVVCGMQGLATMAAKSLKKVYFYITVQEPVDPICLMGPPPSYCSHYSFHMFDIVASFGNSPALLSQFHPADLAFGDSVRKVFSEFVRTGGDASLPWPKFDATKSSVLLFQTDPKISPNPKLENCQLWNLNGLGKKYMWHN